MQGKSEYSQIFPYKPGEQKWGRILQHANSPPPHSHAFVLAPRKQNNQLKLEYGNGISIKLKIKAYSTVTGQLTLWNRSPTLPIVFIILTSHTCIRVYEEDLIC